MCYLQTSLTLITSTVSRTRSLHKEKARITREGKNTLPVYSPVGTPGQSSQSSACQSDLEHPANPGSDGICGSFGGPSAVAASLAVGAPANRYIYFLEIRLIHQQLNRCKEDYVTQIVSNNFFHWSVFNF